MKTRVVIMSAIAGLLAAVGAIYLTTKLFAPAGLTAPVGQFQPLPTPQGPLPVAPRVGARAPAFEARRFDGGTLRLNELRGKGVVMNFWASWCVPCREEARDLEATYQKYRARQIVFVGVDIQQDTWEDARGFLKEFGITYPAIRDEDGKIALKYQMYGLPTTFFIDKDGVLRGKYVGPFLGPEGLRELERRIAAVLP